MEDSRYKKPVYRVPKGTRVARTLDGARPHTVWCRHDIWEAAKHKSQLEKRPIRSIVEEALYKLLLEDDPDAPPLVYEFSGQHTSIRRG